MNAALAVQILNVAQAVLNWLATRGLTKDRALELLQLADNENRDLTTAEVQAELDLTQAELDETQAAIDRMNPGRINSP